VSGKLYLPQRHRALRDLRLVLLEHTGFGTSCYAKEITEPSG